VPPSSESVEEEEVVVAVVVVVTVAGSDSGPSELALACECLNTEALTSANI